MNFGRNYFRPKCVFLDRCRVICHVRKSRGELLVATRLWSLKIIVRMKEMLCSLLVTNRHGGVVVAVALTHRQGHPTGVVAAVPAHRHAVAEDGRTIDAGQAPVNPVESCGGVVGAVEYELRVSQSIQFVVQHHIRPVEVEHGHISQVDDTVGIAVDIVTIAVQEVKRSVKDRSEGDAQDPVDDGGTSVGVPSSGDYRAIPCDGSRTIGTSGGRQGTTPVVAREVPVEVVAVVVVVVVIAVVGIVTVVAAMLTVITMSLAVAVIGMVTVGPVMSSVVTVGLVVSSVVTVRPAHASVVAVRLVHAAVVAAMPVVATLVATGLVLSALGVVRLGGAARAITALTVVHDAGTYRTAAVAPCGFALVDTGGGIIATARDARSGGRALVAAAAGGGATINAGAVVTAAGRTAAHLRRYRAAASA